jgi:arabinose-5-phosphate isomerase
MTKITINDVLLTTDKIPVVGPKTLLKQTLEKMSEFGLGIASVVDDDGKLAGVFTDGDVRRMLLKDQKPFSALFVDDIIVHSNKTPATINIDKPLSEAIAMMEDMEIWDLPVIDSQGKLKGLLHLHPIVKAMMDADGA